MSERLRSQARRVVGRWLADRLVGLCRQSWLKEATAGKPWLNKHSFS